MNDAAGQYHPFFDMCGYCELSAGGVHGPKCPLSQPFPIQQEPQVKINLTINLVEVINVDNKRH